ncbi:MAG: putative zinc-binding protein [Dehalococcoidia bacterium]|nr:putative zinc-binding protein [Dehalococcoidia bacterium]
MAKEEKFQAGVNTHENVIFSCYGGVSNTGITSALASLEAVKELGLEKAAVMCLGGLPTHVKSVLGKTQAAEKIVTVDGCPFECARKIVEQAGFSPISIMLTRDIGMKKKGLSEDIGKEIKGVMEYISDDEVKRAKELIIKTILEE